MEDSRKNCDEASRLINDAEFPIYLFLYLGYVLGCNLRAEYVLVSDKILL